MIHDTDHAIFLIGNLYTVIQALSQLGVTGTEHKKTVTDICREAEMPQDGCGKREGIDGRVAREEERLTTLLAGTDQPS